MSGGRSALSQIGVFGAASAALGMIAAFTIVVATPTPQAPRMTVAQVAHAIRAGPVNDGELSVTTGRMPKGLRAPVVEAALAALLGLDTTDVRAVWLGRDAPVAPGAIVELHRTKRIAERFVVTSHGATPPSLPRDALLAITKIDQPGFTAAVAKGDGKWIVIRPEQSFWSRWHVRLATTFLLCLLLLVPLSWVVARHITLPLRLLAERAEGEAVGSIRLASGPREVQAAADAIDAMKMRLTAQTAERSRMLAAVAHDLRTPLTSLSVRAEMAPSAARDRMLADIGRMEAMIREVLDFSTPQIRTFERINVSEAARCRATEAQARGESVDMEDGPDIFAEVDPVGFDRALDNLIQNAERYAGGGTIRVCLTDGQVSIVVEDNGPGVKPADRERLLVPFARGEASRSRQTGGTGLGLSIVQDFTMNHGGTFSLRNGSDTGTVAVMILPLALAKNKN